MTRRPAVIIVVRHGARLDAADKSWHLTSPTPYDPPLTYGGWTQSRALGLRIASLLQAREAAILERPRASDANPEDSLGFSQTYAEDKDNHEQHRPKRRKHKVVIHSSPFVRCVQTSIGIGAGLASFQKDAVATKVQHSKAHAGSRLRSASGRSLDSIPEPDGELEDGVEPPTQQPHGIEKVTLRIDAFLGEWLSPDYFDGITPPPDSTLMVAGAKADLLRGAEHIEYTQMAVNGTGNFPGGWRKFDGATARPTTSQSADSPLGDLGALAQALPRQSLSERAGSVDSSSSSGSRPGSRATRAPKSSTADQSRYVAPVPAYAVSTSEPIPRGYVAHARDACTSIDYQWDSMREPQEWGDGGQLGDEWSGMHRRFRRGLNNMIAWYTIHGADLPGESESATEGGQDTDDDEDTDLALVLVTHGAGCNALVGALTNQPVLLDFGMASLTMAVRRMVTPPNSRSFTPVAHRRRSSIDLGLSDDYEMRLLASTEHLRAGVDPSKAPKLPVKKLVRTATEYPSQYSTQTAGPITIDTSAGMRSPSEPIPMRAMSSALGSIRRSTLASAGARTYTAELPVESPVQTSASPTGLWSKGAVATNGSPSIAGAEGKDKPHISFQMPEKPGEKKDTEPQKESIGREAPKSTEPSKEIKTPQPAEMPRSKKPQDPVKQPQAGDKVGPIPPGLGRTMSQRGLWGAAPRGAKTEREAGPKRRWTVTQHDNQ